jgi:hypothetical protein
VPRKEPDCCGDAGVPSGESGWGYDLRHPGCAEREEVSMLPAGLAPLVGGEEPLGGEGYIPWAALLEPVDHVDVLACPCGGKRRFVGYVSEPEKTCEGLEALGLWSEAPKGAKASRLPQEEFFERGSDADGVDPPPPVDVA